MVSRYSTKTPFASSSLAKIIAILLTMAGLYVSPAVAQEATVLKKPAEEWTNFNESSDTKEAASHANVVFLRAAKATQKQAVNLFVNGEYLTSLLAGGYKKTSVCLGRNRLGASIVNSDTRYEAKHNPRYAFDINDSEVRYFQVMIVSENEKNRAIVRAVPEIQAQNLLKQLKEQKHSVARIEKNRRCVPPETMAQPANIHN